jgi:hypothetical protein
MLKAKPYLLTLFEREGYVHATVVAPTIDYDLAMEYLADMCDQARSAGHTRVLLERDIPASLDSAATFAVARDSVEFLRGLKIACLNKYADNEVSLSFAATVASNRGANYKYFASRSEAEAWLLSNG